jgi:hypothetical protein
MIPDRIIQSAAKNPKALFVIDCVGALISVFLLAVVLPRFEALFGIPRATLFFLALFPCLFAVYDLNCFISVGRNPGRYLKIIAIMNFGYCIISLITAMYQYNDITLFGWLYIVGEVMLVVVLAVIEFQVAKRVSILSYEKVSEIERNKQSSDRIDKSGTLAP